MRKRQFTAEFKTKVVLELLREEKQLGELASEHDISPNQLRNWKKEFLENAHRVFDENRREKGLRTREKELEDEHNILMAKVGQLTIENDWLKKNPLKCLDLTTRKNLISPNSKLSIKQQCDLLEINRSSVYYTPAIANMERDELIKSRLDYWHTKMCYLGVRRLKAKLAEDGIHVGRKLIKRQMEEMGIYCIYPKPNLSKRNLTHKIHPYLLRNISITLPNQVWAVDITYIKMGRSHMYLTAIIDWYSRYIVGWALSDTLDTAPVLEAVSNAITKYGKPGIINSDQGSQFTSSEYTEFIKTQEIRQSMDGRARWVDNVIIERWFRSLKCDHIYINEYENPKELRAGISSYISEYNTIRPHQTFDYLTPMTVYTAKKAA